MQEIWTDFCQRVPRAACSWNMFNQHLHCIIYTTWLIIWATVALTAYESKVILSNVSKHLAIASVSGEGLEGRRVSEHVLLHADIF